jgi:endo-alpha-1,4-polygalactosaminidase (GH114 family)
VPPSTPAEAVSASLTPSVSSPAPPVSGDGPTTPSDLPGPLAGVDDFLYQLQDIDLNAIGGTAYDLVIIDYSSGGGEDGAFSRE